MGSIRTELSKPTSILGLKVSVVVGIVGIGACAVVLILFCFWLWRRRKENSDLTIPSKEITIDDAVKIPDDRSAKTRHDMLEAEVTFLVRGNAVRKILPEKNGAKDWGIQHIQRAVGEGKDGSVEDHGNKLSGTPNGVPADMEWGQLYTHKELEVATESFAKTSVLGEGGYGTVYLGKLADGTCVAVKKLLNNKGQAEKEFKVEVEAIGRVRHKNLVRLIGYCMEGSLRMLVYEYVDNGSLSQWLHGPLGRKQALPWDVRMKIILGTARGLAYLHDGLEPKVVHRDVKSSNILLDKQWNAKVSDFGLAKLLGAENTHVTTRVMGTFGYVAPEYALTGMLTEKSDVYGYGVLVMELVTGRVPVDYSRPSGEVHLVEWLKTMIGNRLFDEVADPMLPSKPSPRSLKRALLVALRCVDPDAQKRPKMSHVVHTLEAEDSPS